MVKELDLFESNNGCGRTDYPVKNIRNGRNTTLHGPELDAQRFPKAVRGVGDITHGLSTFEYFDLTGGHRNLVGDLALPVPDVLSKRAIYVCLRTN